MPRIRQGQNSRSNPTAQKNSAQAEPVTKAAFFCLEKSNNFSQLLTKTSLKRSHLKERPTIWPRKPSDVDRYPWPTWPYWRCLFVMKTSMVFLQIDRMHAASNNKKNYLED